MKHWFSIWLLSVAMVIVSACLDAGLLAHPGYRAFLEAARRVGWRGLIVSAVVLVADLVAMTIYTVRHGKTDNNGGKVFEDCSPDMSLGSAPPFSISKRKMFAAGANLFPWNHWSPAPRPSGSS